MLHPYSPDTQSTSPMTSVAAEAEAEADAMHLERINLAIDQRKPLHKYVHGKV